MLMNAFSQVHPVLDGIRGDYTTVNAANAIKAAREALPKDSGVAVSTAVAQPEIRQNVSVARLGGAGASPSFDNLCRAIVDLVKFSCEGEGAADRAGTVGVTLQNFLENILLVDVARMSIGDLPAIRDSFVSLSRDMGVLTATLELTTLGHEISEVLDAIGPMLDLLQEGDALVRRETEWADIAANIQGAESEDIRMHFRDVERRFLVHQRVSFADDFVRSVSVASSQLETLQSQGMARVGEGMVRFQIKALELLLRASATVGTIADHERESCTAGISTLFSGFLGKNQDQLLSETIAILPSVSQMVQQKSAAMKSKKFTAMFGERFGIENTTLSKQGQRIQAFAEALTAVANLQGMPPHKIVTHLKQVFDNSIHADSPVQEEGMLAVWTGLGKKISEATHADALSARISAVKSGEALVDHKLQMMQLIVNVVEAIIAFDANA